MILVAGGTGRLGSRVVELLRARGLRVRVLTRNRVRARQAAEAQVEIVEGDVRDLNAVRRAVAGARTVVSAIQGFAGTKDASPATIDRDGNRNLIQAAREAKVEHFVLTSVKDAAPDHPMELMRMKYAAEQDLKAGGLEWTIVRPTAFMETWCEVLGRPLLEKGKTQVFGHGRSPINWVSASDVARFIELAIVDRRLRGEVIEVGGPEDLSMTAFLEVFRTGVGLTGKVGHIPPIAMRLTAIAMRLVNPSLARQIRAAIVMDSAPMTFDASGARRRYPSIPVTYLTEVVRRDFAQVPGTDRMRSAS
jgi:uncharacterized protein YbjT (DUF2867 family)